MSNPLISIIAPVYKVQEQYLRDCIISLQNQTYSNIEIILVDDGSPDNCGLVCDDFAKKIIASRLYISKMEAWFLPAMLVMKWQLVIGSVLWIAMIGLMSI